MTTSEYRIEHDTMGEVRVPASALYRAQTQRAVENFPISGAGLEPAQIVALARIKRAAAIVNGEMGIVAKKLRTASVVSLSRLECLHFTRSQITELEESIPAFKAALEASTAERSQPSE